MCSAVGEANAGEGTQMKCYLSVERPGGKPFTVEVTVALTANITWKEKGVGMSGKNKCILREERESV